MDAIKRECDRRPSYCFRKIDWHPLRASIASKFLIWGYNHDIFCFGNQLRLTKKTICVCERVVSLDAQFLLPQTNIDVSLLILVRHRIGNSINKSNPTHFILSHLSRDTFSQNSTRKFHFVYFDSFDFTHIH